MFWLVSTDNLVSHYKDTGRARDTSGRGVLRALHLSRQHQSTQGPFRKSHLYFGRDVSRGNNGRYLFRPHNSLVAWTVASKQEGYSCLEVVLRGVCRFFLHLHLLSHTSMRHAYIIHSTNISMKQNILHSGHMLLHEVVASCAT